MSPGPQRTTLIKARVYLGRLNDARRKHNAFLTLFRRRSDAENLLVSGA
jgi:hypothetical protein